MPIICPTITAYTEEEYKSQMDKVAHLANRIQIDLTDGQFTAKATIAPEKAWWPVGFKADFHLMYKQPMAAVRKVIKHKPSLIIVHAEAEDDFSEIATFCRHHAVKTGIALLPATPIGAVSSSLGLIDHVLIFSGNLGHQGGSFADLELLQKVEDLRKMDPTLEIGWDGGINDQNVAELVSGGVDVLNVGGYIQNSDDPAKAFDALDRIAQETGET